MSNIFPSPNPGRLRIFIRSLAALLDERPPEARLLHEGGALLQQLIAVDDWLPDVYTQAQPERYQQYLLHADSAERFSIVSFVWGPGQTTPIHDHTVWGLIGMLRGAEYSQAYKSSADGRLRPDGEPVKLLPGTVEAVSPTVGDIHQVRNAFADNVSVSIHVYGANIGAVKRSVYGEDGSRKSFISGYSNSHLPNIWDRSIELKNQ
ncbi:Cysteine dioxygenase [Collimonas arenae]|uniref:Cysteine dioxygenase n=1 Tax=Collimonas arenae TaxID=279058 RepID=A0A0A1FDS4_9BURK|nr:cysteine dioxygenase [Collimonas arenae]AIY41769.1 Cysteine dioxygenase [Collimonas arenae]